MLVPDKGLRAAQQTGFMGESYKRERLLTVFIINFGSFHLNVSINFDIKFRKWVQLSEPQINLSKLKGMYQDCVFFKLINYSILISRKQKKIQKFRLNVDEVFGPDTVPESQPEAEDSQVDMDTTESSDIALRDFRDFTDSEIPDKYTGENSDWHTLDTFEAWQYHSETPLDDDLLDNVRYPQFNGKCPGPEVLEDENEWWIIDDILQEVRVKSSKSSSRYYRKYVIRWLGWPRE